MTTKMKKKGRRERKKHPAIPPVSPPFLLSLVDMIGRRRRRTDDKLTVPGRSAVPAQRHEEVIVRNHCFQ